MTVEVDQGRLERSGGRWRPWRAAAGLALVALAGLALLLTRRFGRRPSGAPSARSA